MLNLNVADRSQLFASLQTIANITDSHKELLSRLPVHVVSIAEGAEIQQEGETPTNACLLLSGLLCSFKMCGDGNRQLLSLHLPGDIPDLQTLYLDCTDHGLVAVCPSRVGYIPYEALRSLMAHEPSIAALLVKRISIDGAICREWIVNIGRRHALSRMAHLFCEFFVRQRALGIASDNVMSLPLTQVELGDATGLSAVHVNRVMQELRRRGLISSRGNHHRVTDWRGLMSIGDFRADYLHLRTPMAQLGL
jgi:CRP-like cAMP-binding protein